MAWTDYRRDGATLVSQARGLLLDAAIAASTRDATAVAVMTLDYDRLRATTFAP